jgi:hypothetical protein
MGDIPNAATYNSDSGNEDELKAAVTLEPLEDQGAIPSSFDGRLSYGGTIKYEAELSLATDEIQLKIIRHFKYDGKKSYDGKTYLLWVYRRGILIEKYEDHNLIVNCARSVMAHLVTSDSGGKPINRISFGTNGAVLSPTNTSTNLWILSMP